MAWQQTAHPYEGMWSMKPEASHRKRSLGRPTTAPRHLSVPTPDCADTFETPPFRRVWPLEIRRELARQGLHANTK